MVVSLFNSDDWGDTAITLKMEILVLEFPV